MLRRLTGVVLVALVALLVAGAVPALAFDRAANENKMLKLINQARTSRGLPAVKVVKSLDTAALKHARDMIARDYFSHKTRSGASVATRAKKAGYSTSGYRKWAVSEVIALGTGLRGTPESVFKTWMNSISHRRIILNKNWRDVGVGCARGTYKGKSGVVIYTVDFGRRVK